ncbi:zinc transport system substrate-binding protein [Stackebrandtia albiflava]|uniref:Zinc transport system substrate-binding protein n=1 Tax=Stackebrandtia albiflava TaxID=406432 RepID=A0A562VAP5_9ACTN|nr:metal ABC transporter substrate-binding protein [Stackebrandtia albiflava]TWJ14960.1 zinc transport system substrate-binding protein [Stackebrandtia albiflava]
MTTPLTRRLAGITVAGVTALALAACGGTDEASDADVTAVASFYPLQFVTERIGGDHVAVQSLTAAGAEPHDLTLAPQQVADLIDADLVIYLAGFQPAVDEAITEHAPDKALDVATATELIEGHSHEHGEEGEHAEEGHEGHHHDESGLDPHVWLDPTKLAEIAEAVADRLAETDPANESHYRAEAGTLVDELTALDQRYQDGLAECRSRDIVTSHAAFGYLADRYDLHQVAVSGLTPDAAPTSEAFRQVTDYVEEHGVTTVFYETLVSPDVAETIAAETGADTAVLDPIEGLAEGSTEDYFSIMDANLATLVTALGCES